MVTIEKIVTVCTVMIKKVVYIIVTHNVNMIANNNTFLDGDFYHHRSHLVVNQSQPLSTLFLFHYCYRYRYLIVNVTVIVIVTFTVIVIVILMVGYFG